MESWSAGVVAAYRGSDRPAVISPGAMVTGSGLLAAAAGAAGWFESFGLPAGRPLPALVTTSADTLAMLLAGAATGHPLAPLGPRLTAAELGGAVNGLGGQLLLHEPAFAGLAAELARATGVRPVPVSGLPEAADLGRLAAPDGDEVAAYLHTGGTTGAPKPVPLTQRVLARRSALLAGLTGMDAPDAVYATGSPIHHIGGLGNTLAALSAGAAVVAAASFSADWWRGLQAHGVTHALLVPSMIEMLLADEALDVVKLRTLIYGASPIRPETLALVLDKMPTVALVNLFGQTEGSPITCLTPADHVLASAGRPELLQSVGRPVPGLDLRIDAPDETGAGEVLARAAHLSLPAPDGWLRTGDIGRLDADGYLYLVGRTHDRIVRGGENVYPAEVERVLESHPGVAAAGVTGVPDERLGQTIAAFVIPSDASQPPDANGLRRFARERLAGFKVPAFWYSVGSLPHSAAGKLLRRELASWHADPAAAGEPLTSLPLASEPTYSAIINLSSKHGKHKDGRMVSPGRHALRKTTSGGDQLVRVPKAAELVAADLRRQIIRGELAEGDALPTESDLMVRFGVSRPTLREAFRVLESENLIAIRRGARGGARVQPPDREVAARYAAFTLEYRGVTLRDVYDARTALEVPSVGKLALDRTEADLGVLEAALTGQQAVAQDARESIRLHGDFHTLLVRLAGNQTLTLLNEMLHDIVEVANTSLQPATGSAVQSARESTNKTHRRVLEHIRARDQRRAEDLWRRHLREAQGYLLGEDVVSTVTDLLH